MALFDLDPMREILERGSGLLFLPAVGLAALISVVVSTPVARRLDVSRVSAWLLLMCFGMILAATLVPSREALLYGAHGTLSCDLSRIGPTSLAEYRRFDDPTWNILFFVPLGAILGWLPRSRHKRVLVVAAILLPFAIELTQAVVVPLDRACQGGDVFDNLFGLFVGLAIGWVAGALWRSRGIRMPRRSPDGAGGGRGRP